MTERNLVSRTMNIFENFSKIYIVVSGPCSEMFAIGETVIMHPMQLNFLG